MTDTTEQVKDAAAHMRTLAKTIDKVNEEVLGSRKGFALIVFEFNAPSFANYISNADRDDIVLALRALANRIEKGETKEWTGPTPSTIH